VKHDLLKECVEALRALRAKKHKELDAGVIAELEQVIHRLEACLKNGVDDAVLETELKVQSLELINKCLGAVTNIAELISQFFGPE
jgi:hypothetical protein